MERQQWKEKDFERWFLANPILPEDESMLVIARERSICRVADIVALDKLGRIWVMEIKNEKSTRSALGQAMEYLAQFDEIEPEGLADEFANLASGDLTREFQERFHIPFPGLSPARRIVLVAPSFDAHSCNIVQFLNKILESREIQFLLLAAERAQDQFHVRYVDPPKLTHSSNMVGRFGQTPAGRLVYVFDGGNPQTLWYIGKPRDDGSIRLAKGQAVTRVNCHNGLFQ